METNNQNQQQQPNQQTDQNNDQNQQNGQNQQQNQQQTQKTWEEVLKGLPEDQQKLYTEHTTGLQNAVKATRDERDDLAKQIKDLLPKAEKGSELEKSLTEALGKLDDADKRANFAEQAIKPEIGCRNVKAAFALAKEGDLFKKNGDPDWEAIKKEAPELFGPLIPEGNGGSGTGDDQKPPVDMNQWIRERAGVKSN